MISKIIKAVNIVERLWSAVRGITGKIMKHPHVLGVSCVMKYVSPVYY